MDTISVTVRMDKILKKQLEILLEDMGLNMTTGFTVFAKAVVRQGKIPFELIADPFLSETNQTRIGETLKNYDSSKLIYKAIEELEAMANE